ncbi:hypothetical protein BK010_04555 [Tenericutes bacterium MO-XQ]|nr:hypothetical protein BK010_04555 [Tenericutes bacterium MO-XQ]
MSSFDESKKRTIDGCSKQGMNFQNLIKKKFVENVNFSNAANENNNEENNNFLQEIFSFFGNIIISLTSDYTTQVHTTTSLEDLREALKIDLQNVINQFNLDIDEAVNKLLRDTLVKIENSGFLTEIITNPEISSRSAKREFEKL